MTFNTQFLIPSFNISLQNLPRHSENAKALAKGNLCFLQCVLQIIVKAKLPNIYINF